MKKAKPMKPKKSRDIPATQGMLYEVRGELKSGTTSIKLEIKSLEKRIDARFNQMEEKFSLIDARFNQMEEKFSLIDARFNQMESKIETVISAIHRVAGLVEEQNARNIAVLDSYTLMYESHESLSQRVKSLEKNS